jgi:hypothetical protein
MAPGPSFIDAAKNRYTPYRSKCSAGAIIEKLDEALRAEVFAAFALDPSELPARAIAEELTARGYPIKDQAISRHRAGRCACPDDLRRFS